MPGAFRREGGIGALAGGGFLLAGHLLNVVGGDPAGTAAGKTLVLAGHVVLVFAFVGLYSYQQRQEAAPVGQAGMLLGTVGTVLVSAIVFVEIAETTGVDTTPVFEAAGTTLIYTVGPLVFVLGMLLVGGSILRRTDLPRAGGALLIAGTAVFAAASAVPDVAAVLTLLGAALTAGGFGWLGVTLLWTDASRTATGGLG